MRKKVVTGICILLAIVLLIPIPMRLKDGGTVVYNAILYQVENVHRIDPEATSENDYLEGLSSTMKTRAISSFISLKAARQKSMSGFRTKLSG